jgi:hypothetical protein
MATAGPIKAALTRQSANQSTEHRRRAQREAAGDYDSTAANVTSIVSKTGSSAKAPEVCASSHEQRAALPFLTDLRENASYVKATSDQSCCDALPNKRAGAGIDISSQKVHQTVTIISSKRAYIPEALRQAAHGPYE